MSKEIIDYLDKCAVIIPYKDCSQILSKCLDSLVPILPLGTKVLLIDDGSTLDAFKDPLLARFLKDKSIHYLRHQINQGPAAARNTGIRWCQYQDLKLVILLDSDCLVQPNFVETHCQLHRQYPDAICIGGSINGIGEGFWARLDGLMSWFTSIPDSPKREVGNIYHIPTTNMSIKLSLLPTDELPFDVRLRTGEDVVFCRKLRNAGARVLFCSQPEIYHLDRTNLRDFLRHQYRWGLHTYVVRFGNLDWGRSKRASVAVIFFFLMPAFAIISSTLNIIPWLKKSLTYLKYWPLLFLVYLFKGVAIFLGICSPGKALYTENTVTGR